MSRYSQAFLIVALFCFLFPFTSITPASNTGTLPMKGWDMLSSQNLEVSKDPPLILNIPLRLPVLFAVIFGGAAMLIKLSRRSNLTLVSAAAATAAAVSLLTLIGSSPVVQLTNGHDVVHRFEDPAVHLLPAFYISIVAMGIGAVTLWMGLQRQGTVQAGRPAFIPARGPGLQSGQPPKSLAGVRGGSFCIKCGDALPSSAHFCNRCGTLVVTAQPPVPAVAKPVETAAPATVETANAQASAKIAPALSPLAAASVAPAPPPSPVPAVAAVAKPPETAPPATETANAAIGSAADASISPAAAPTVASVPPPPPPPRPSPAPPRGYVPQALAPPHPSRFSPGAKLGLAAASVIVMTGIWLAFQHSTDNSPTMSAPTTISIFPATVRVTPGETVQLQALVTGGINREVQWSIQEGTPGGSVEAAGATVKNGNVFLLASYKAPTAPGIYHVVVVSAADQSRKAVVQIYVTGGFPRF